MHEKRAHVLPCTRSRPDQEPCVNAVKENAPSWTHLHLHAVHTLNLVGSDRTACSFDATLLCGRGWATADATKRVPPCQFPAYGSDLANSHNSGQTRIMKISLRPTSDSIPKKIGAGGADQTCLQVCKYGARQGASLRSVTSRGHRAYWRFRRVSCRSRSCVAACRDPKAA